MSKLLKKIRDNKSGATAIEYGLIAALIAVVIITAAGALGGEVSNKFDQVTAAMQTTSP
jgi:pilus assembly protein Flp/PilA